MRGILLMQLTLALLCVVVSGTDNIISGTKNASSSTKSAPSGVITSKRTPTHTRSSTRTITSSKTTLKTSLKTTRKTSTLTSPKISPKSSWKTSPRTTPHTSLKSSPKSSPHTPLKTSSTPKKTSTPRTIHTTTHQGVCERISACSCRYKDGRVVDLAPLDGVADNTVPKFQNKKDPQNDKYTYNPCTAFTTGKCKSVAICQEDAMSTYALGTQESASFYSSKDGLLVQYQSTDRFNETRTSQVQLVCAAGTDSFVPLGETDDGSGLYKFKLTSPHCCAQQNSAARYISPLTSWALLVFVWLARLL